MAALIVLFNLKPDADPKAYEKWAQKTDVPSVKKLKSVDDFRVFKNNALMGSEASPPYQYVEIIEVNDMDQLGKDVASETMQKVAAEFQEFADQPLFMISEQFA